MAKPMLDMDPPIIFNVSLPYKLHINLQSFGHMTTHMTQGGQPDVTMVRQVVVESGVPGALADAPVYSVGILIGQVTGRMTIPTTLQ